MTDLAKMESPNFLHTFSIMYWQGDNADKKKPNRLKVRLNPFHITSYYETVYAEGDKQVPATYLYCGGAPYVIDMRIEEVDEMMNNIDRGMSIKE